MSIKDVLDHHVHDDFQTRASEFLLTWTPRLIFAAVAGYYSLGIAYDVGLMAAVDRVAIDILKNIVGYAGIGAVMPTFQWYAAWGVRVTAAAGGAAIWDLSFRTGRFFYHKVRDCFFPPVMPSAAGIVRV